MINKLLRLSIALLATLASGYGHAENSRVQFGIEVSAGVKYDSSVAVPELDNNSDEPDRATVLEAGVDMRIATSSRTALRFGYDFGDTSYRQFSRFDLALHHGVAEFAVNGRHVDLALTADRFDGLLDDDRYLTLTQYSPSVSKLFGSRVFLRAAFITANKDYELLPARNATSNAARIDAYLLLDGMHRYLSVGMQQTTEDAFDPELDFDGLRAAIAYGHTVTLSQMQLQWKAQLKYETRDYLNVTESIAATRRDRRLRGSLAVSIPFTEHLKLEATIEHSDNESNVDAAVIDKMIYGLGLSVVF